MRHGLNVLKAQHVVFKEDQLCQVCYKKILNQVFGCLNGQVVHVFCMDNKALT